jgi:hypothetical protein
MIESNPLITGNIRASTRGTSGGGRAASRFEVRLQSKRI